MAAATRKLPFHIIVTFAQFERDNMIENTKVGLDAAKSSDKNDG
jgi:DNA invertase Pin-like site-specific DNA recombinase